MASQIGLYYRYIYRENLDFKYRLYQLSKINDFNKSIDMANKLINRAVCGSVGYFASSELEKPFLKLAKTIESSSDIPYVPKSFLHVMTTSYASGGHTRVVERWINTSCAEQTHSVVLLEQGENVISEALNVCTNKHHGEVILINEKDLKRKAKLLRDLGSQYEYIILHVHMWDPTPIVAFGTEDFKRPVIFFNHADNLFWCCSSIVDILAEIRSNNFAKIRGIDNTFVLRIPFDNSIGDIFSQMSKEQSRKKVGLPMDKTVILTVGSSQKFETFDGCDFCSVVKEAIVGIPDVVCVGIGPDEKTGRWNMDKDKFLPVGKIDYGNDYFDYLNACDIYMDSIPIGGGTAKLDAIQFHKPVVSYSFFKQPFGEIVMGVDSINDKRIFNTVLRRLITDEEFRSEFANNEYRVAEKFHGTEEWKKNLEQMFSIVPLVHKVNNGFICGRKRIDELDIMNVLWWRRSPCKKIGLYDLWHKIKSIGYKG